MIPPSGPVVNPEVFHVEHFAALAGPPPQQRRHPLRDCASRAAPARAHSRSHEGRRSTACLAHHMARGPAARCAAAPLSPGKAGPCACAASATPRRACGRSTPTRRGWAPRLLRSLRSLRIGGGRVALRAPSFRPLRGRAPACRCSRAHPGKAASRRLRRCPSGSLAGAVRVRRSRRRCSGQKRPVTGLGLFWPSACAGRAAARPTATPPH